SDDDRLLDRLIAALGDELRPAVGGILGGLGGHRLGGVGGRRRGRVLFLLRAPTAATTGAGGGGLECSLQRPLGSHGALPALPLHHSAEPRDVLVTELRHMAAHRNVHLPKEVDERLGGDVEFLRYFVHSHPSTYLPCWSSEGGSAASTCPARAASSGLVSPTAETGARPQAAPNSSRKNAL